MSEFKVEDLTDELIKKQLMEWDEFSIFVRSHVYLQYYVNRATEKMLSKNPELHTRTDFTTSLKLQVLHGMKFLSNVMYHNSKIMNSIRNSFAHTLRPDDQSIQAQIKNMKMPWMAPDSTKNMSIIQFIKLFQSLPLLNLKMH